MILGILALLILEGALQPAPPQHTSAHHRSIALTAVVVTAADSNAERDSLPWSAIVDDRHTGAAGAPGTAGVPMYRTIGDALTGQAVNGGVRTVIFIRNGRYREKLTIDRPRVTLRGESRDGVVITFDAASDTPAPGGGTYGTRGSFTLRIVAPDFRAERLTIENAFDYAANAAKPDSDRTKFRNPQGVALMTDLGSDRAAFVDVTILGNQDTVFTNSGRAWFFKCRITGHVDFIFGAGQAVFEECDIVSKDRGSRTNNGYIAAPSTNIAQPFGLLFLRSRLLKESPAMAPNSVSLGRPWHPFADPQAIGSAVFVECWMDDHIRAAGWERMSSTDSTGTRIWYEPASARFFEYRSTGPGAVPAGAAARDAASSARRQLSPTEAAPFLARAPLGDWRPSADLPAPR
jgi:pectinesterase